MFIWHNCMTPAVALGAHFIALHCAAQAAFSSAVAAVAFLPVVSNPALLVKLPSDPPPAHHPAISIAMMMEKN